MAPRKESGRVPLRRRVLIAAARVMLALAGASLLLAAVITARLVMRDGWSWRGIGNVPDPAATVASPATPAISQQPMATTSALEPVAPDPAPAVVDQQPVLAGIRPIPFRVGIVAGHAGNDSGAVCPDGTTEADVNMAVAQIVAELLSQAGAEVDLLDEFDPLLSGYRADALVSVHADSCEVPGASGFKVARVTDSAIPEAEDRLVDCLYQEYGATTGLASHPNSITDNMTNYHAFSEIDANTPGAIIETGFLLDDQAWIVRRPRTVARGIVNGVLCFLSDGALP